MTAQCASVLAQATQAVAEGGTTWMPPQASRHAAEVDAVFYFIYWVSACFFVLIVVLMLVFVFRYRRRRAGEAAAGRATHSTALELTWTAIPLVLVGLMFYLGFRGFMDMTNPPANALDINVVGQKWLWTFTYPNGHVDTELHVPVDTPVRLILSSSDVIHSFFVPEFRVKKDAVPGRYNKLWFQATRAGDFLALCAEYCGTQHSDMLARVVVHEPGGYEKWLAEASDPFSTRSPAQVGALLHHKRCGGCHSVDGSANIGPTFKGLYGRAGRYTDGSTGVAEENYIRESIVNPQKKIVAGYEPVMPTFKGQLKDNEISAIIAYLKELSGYGGAATTTPAETGAPQSQEAAP